LDIKSAIWRRIQVRDCTLGSLHEHIQIAMGSEDSLNHFGVTAILIVTPASCWHSSG
jgi:hypothetical protein